MNSFSWVSFPVRDESFYKTVLLIGITVTFFIFTMHILNTLFALLGFFVLLFSIFRYFVPTRYEASPMGIKINGFFFNKEKKWSEFQSFYVAKDGVFLSPFKKASKLDIFRGLFLKTGKKTDPSFLIKVVKENLDNK
jgi:hypothetical protein